MTKNTICSVYIIAVLFAITGCRTDFTAETQAVNSLLGVLEQVDESSNGIDSRLIRDYVKNVGEECSIIQDQIVDTLDLLTAQKLVRFCDLKTHLQNCLERKEKIDAQVLETRNQLFNLKTDLTQRVSDKDSVKTHIEMEFLYVESLNDGVEAVIAELNGCFETYAELKDDIDRLLISLPKEVTE